MSENSEVTGESNELQYSPNEGPQYRESDTATQYSPFGPTEAPGIQLVTQMRMYDVLMAIYTEMNKAGAAELMEIHTKGGIIGSLPLFDPNLLRSES